MLGWTPDWLMIGVALAMIASCRVIPSLIWLIITAYSQAVWQAKHKRKYASDRFISDWPRIWSWSMATILWYFCYNYCFTSYASVSSRNSILNISYSVLILAWIEEMLKEPWQMFFQVLTSCLPFHKKYMIFLSVFIADWEWRAWSWGIWGFPAWGIPNSSAKSGRCSFSCPAQDQ